MENCPTGYLSVPSTPTLITEGWCVYDLGGGFCYKLDKGYADKLESDGISCKTDISEGAGQLRQNCPSGFVQITK